MSRAYASSVSNRFSSVCRSLDMYSAAAIDRNALTHFYIDFWVCHHGARSCVDIQPWYAIKGKRLIKIIPSKYTLNGQQTSF